jgi:hypothetical protein
MMKYFLLIFFSINLYAATLLNQNIYERDGRIDLMLSFDSVYEGKISKTTVDNVVVVTLSGATAENRYVNEINHPLVQKIEILKGEGDKQILVNFYPLKNVDIVAAKTGDSYGLRLRVTQTPLATKPTQAQTPQTQAQTTVEQPRLGFETKEELQISNSYIYTVVGLGIVAILLFFLKRKVATGKESWLLPMGASTAKKGKKLSIKFQKVIDNKNKVVLIDYEGREYLTLVGNSNILLDTFENGEVVTDDSFENVFQQNKEKLNEYLKLGHRQEKTQSDKFRENAERV